MVVREVNRRLRLQWCRAKRHWTLPVLRWPAQFPDMTSIENIQLLFMRHVRRRSHLIGSVEVLKRELLTAADCLGKWLASVYSAPFRVPTATPTDCHDSERPHHEVLSVCCDYTGKKSLFLFLFTFRKERPFWPSVA